MAATRSKKAKSPTTKTDILKQTLNCAKVNKSPAKVKARRSRCTEEPKKPLGFLDLPAEIRNSIYELTLSEDGTVEVDEALQLPPILASCTRIRDEACSIWYCDNEFSAKVVDCDATALNKWTYHCCTVGQRDHFEVSIELEGYVNWRNLVKWCQAIWKDDKARRLVSEPDMSDIEHFVSTAHNTAMYFKNKPWRVCVDALETMKIEEEGNADVFDQRHPALYVFDEYGMFCDHDEPDGVEWKP